MFEKPVREKDLLILLILSLVFYTLMFSQDFGQVYSQMTIAWLALLLFDKLGTRYPIEKSTKNRLESVLIAIIFTAIMLLVSATLTSIFYPGTIPQGASTFEQMKGVIGIFATRMAQASEPILRDSIILMFIGWAFIIPIVESHLINGRLFEWLVDRLKNRGININKITAIMVSLFILIGAVAAVLHLSSKNLAAPDLMVTTIFFGLSCVVVFWRKQTREVILGHMLTNGLAVVYLVGWLH